MITEDLFQCSYGHLAIVKAADVSYWILHKSSYKKVFHWGIWRLTGGHTGRSEYPMFHKRAKIRVKSKKCTPLQIDLVQVGNHWTVYNTNVT